MGEIIAGELLHAPFYLVPIWTAILLWNAAGTKCMPASRLPDLPITRSPDYPISRFAVSAILMYWQTSSLKGL